MIEETIIRKLNEIEDSTYIDKNNIVYIVGTLSCKLDKPNHEIYGEKFYKATISVKRDSGVEDNILIIISERLLSGHIDVGSRVEIVGSFRSYNKKDEITKKSRSILKVFVQYLRLIEPKEDIKDENMIYLNGFICKQPTYRTTPLGSEISDNLLAVNRAHRKSSYIPCITWGINARFFHQLPIGTNISVYGRIQSRKYLKEDVENEIREVSVFFFQELQ